MHELLAECYGTVNCPLTRVNDLSCGLQQLLVSARRQMCTMHAPVFRPPIHHRQVHLALDMTKTTTVANHEDGLIETGYLIGAVDGEEGREHVLASPPAVATGRQHCVEVHAHRWRTAPGYPTAA